MALHFIKGGSTGATDGDIISNGTLSGPIVADGFYPAAGTTVQKHVNFHIRADSGEQWKNVVYCLCSSTPHTIMKDIALKDNLIAVVDGTFPIYYGCIDTVTDSNSSARLAVAANGSDTNSPDMSVKLVIISAMRVNPTTGLVAETIPAITSMANTASASVVNDSNLMFLIGGTPGKTDGIEVTDLNFIFKNALTEMSGAANNRYDYPLYDITSPRVSLVPVCLRSRTGFKHSSIVIKKNNTSFTALSWSSGAEWTRLGQCSDSTTIANVTATENVLVYFLVSLPRDIDTISQQQLFSVSFVEDVA